MFCSKCGNEIANDSVFCPACGSKTVQVDVQQEESASKKVEIVNLQQPDEKKEVSLTEQIEQEMEAIRERRQNETFGQWVKKRIKWAGIAFGVIVVLMVVIAVIASFSGSGDKYLELVQNGYLGNYNTVTVQEVLEAYAPDGEWGDGENKDGSKYIVEYKTDTLKVQFTIGDDEKSFKVSGFQGEGKTSTVPSDIKCYLDEIYTEYLEKYPDCGIVEDYSLNNDTLQGYADAKQGTSDSGKQNTENKSEGDTPEKEEETTKKKDTKILGWGGCYWDAELKEYISIAKIDYSYAYLFLGEEGEPIGEIGCTDNNEWLIGSYNTIVKKDNGNLAISSGIGAAWGDFKRVSVVENPDTWIAGTYTNQYYSITLEQPSAQKYEDVKVGGSVATAYIEYEDEYGLQQTMKAILYKQADGSLAMMYENEELLGIATIKDDKMELFGGVLYGTCTQVGEDFRP